MNSESEHSFLCEIYYCIVCSKYISAIKATIWIHKTNFYSFENLYRKEMKTVQVKVRVVCVCVWGGGGGGGGVGDTK